MNDNLSDSYINNLWALHNPGPTDRKRKNQFTYNVWKEDFKYFQKREDSKRLEEKDVWTDIYQLIGFFSVFQGVWFQGVTGLAALQRGCRFSILPIILSLFVSVATIVGVNVKFSKVLTLQQRFSTDKIDNQKRHTKIIAFEHPNLHPDLPERSTEASGGARESEFEKELGSTQRYRAAVIASLTIFSGLFAGLIYAIMCDK